MNLVFQYALQQTTITEGRFWDQSKAVTVLLIYFDQSYNMSCREEA
jgi:hypothetical protein